MNTSSERSKTWPVRWLLFIAGLGGLLYGIDVGIIAGALPYLQTTAITDWHLSSQQISYVVAAVMLGSVLSSLFAGLLSDLFGRRAVMTVSGLCFVASIPIIAMADGYAPLLLGRLLQGVSGGLVGVVVPLYLAECLPAHNRGRGTAIFQWLLTIGLVVAALIGLYYAHAVESAVAATQNTADAAVQSLAVQNRAWRNIFWVSIAPGILFTLGTLLIAESPRWLFRRGRKDAALAALLRTRTRNEAEVEMREMEETRASAEGRTTSGPSHRDSLLSRRYVLPFLIACIILACNQATGVNSILSYVVNILNQAGLPGSVANGGDVSLKILNCLMTVVAVILVDKKGRKFLLMLGTGGIIASLALAGGLFLSAERNLADCRGAVSAMIQDESLNLSLDEALAEQLVASTGVAERFGPSGAKAHRPMQLTVSYAYGPFTNVQSRRTDDPARSPLVVTRENTVQPEGVVEASLRKLHMNPFPSPERGHSAPLHITKATIGPVPAEGHGWLVAVCLFSFMAFYAVGPGVCVWLALSELMPTRIRSNGMSIALLLNQFVSTAIAAVFLPTVGNYGYAVMFFFWAGCTVIYFLTAALLLPETKGKTLEEIEEHFMRHKTTSRNR